MNDGQESIRLTVSKGLSLGKRGQGTLSLLSRHVGKRNLSFQKEILKDWRKISGGSPTVESKLFILN